MTNQENNQAQITIEDLPVAETQQDEISGGAAYLRIGDIKGEARTNQPLPQTREHILLARQTN